MSSAAETLALWTQSFPVVPGRAVNRNLLIFWYSAGSNKNGEIMDLVIKNHNHFVSEAPLPHLAISLAQRIVPV